MSTLISKLRRKKALIARTYRRPKVLRSVMTLKILWLLSHHMGSHAPSRPPATLLNYLRSQEATALREKVTKKRCSLMST